jgi:hypothetical protein
MAETRRAANVDLTRLPEAGVLSASLKGALTRVTMENALNAIEAAMKAADIRWVLLRTHDVELIDRDAVDALSGWLNTESYSGNLDGIGYCPMSDRGVSTRKDVFKKMLQIRKDCQIDWHQAPEVRTVLNMISVERPAPGAEE